MADGDGRCNTCQHWNRYGYELGDNYISPHIKDADGVVWSECERVRSSRTEVQDSRMLIDAADDTDIRFETAADFGCTEYQALPTR
jgi:hypothetical protein